MDDNDLLLTAEVLPEPLNPLVPIVAPYKDDPSGSRPGMHRATGAGSGRQLPSDHGQIPQDAIAPRASSNEWYVTPRSHLEALRMRQGLPAHIVDRVVLTRVARLLRGR